MGQRNPADQLDAAQVTCLIRPQFLSRAGPLWRNSYQRLTLPLTKPEGRHPAEGSDPPKVKGTGHGTVAGQAET